MRFVALVDDHVLLRQGLANLVNTFPGYKVSFEADNGKQFIQKIAKEQIPQAVLMDISMPEMNGYETAAWIRQHHPNIKILALSMSDEDDVIMKMLQSGAHGYILKNSTPEELHQALDTVIKKGFYMNDLVSTNLISSFNKPAEAQEPPFDIKILTDRELEFLKLSCTEMSNAEIADKMNISVRSTEFYKNNIERKLNLKNRVAYVRFALKHGIINL